MMMAKRISTKLHKTLPSLLKPRNSSSSAVTSSLNLEQQQQEQQPLKTQPTLSLEDGESLFSTISSVELLRSLVNLQMASYEPTVDFGMWVLKSRLLMENQFTKKAVLGVVKHTFYKHFCAGENLEEASQTVQKIWDCGLKGILDYGLEDADDNASCDRNLNEFLNIVNSSKLLPPSSVSYACVKITAICPISLLKRVSDLLRWEHQDPSCTLPWKRDTLPLLSNSSALYHTVTRPNPLTAEEVQDLEKAYERVSKLSKKCLDMNLPLLVDAEYTTVQPAIDYLTYLAMMDFNKFGNDPIVYGTIQAYLKDAKERTIQAAEAAKRMGITIALKLVRGAYLSSETKLASSLGYNSPIHNTIQETHACYNDCASFMIDKVNDNSAAVLLATHNVESGKLAVAKAEAIGVRKGNPKLQFAQLKGMAEGLSFGLRNAGYLVSKYLAYGPVEMVVPFLLRRAEENRGVLSASALDRQLMRTELVRRMKSCGM